VSYPTQWGPYRIWAKGRSKATLVYRVNVNSSALPSTDPTVVPFALLMHDRQARGQ
jgi:hypothetical protein